VTYAFLKFIHVVSSTVLFGTGIGSAYYLLRAALDARAEVVARVARWVVLADWLFTSTTVVLQPLTGWYLARMAHFPLQQFWLSASMTLYAIALACWLPVVWLQMRMHALAAEAAQANVALSPQFWRCFKIWFGLGVPAFFAFLGVFYLMVAKPA